MPREGTRSATGNSKPRVFPVVDTAPAVKRTVKPKPKKEAAPKVAAAKGAKPVGVTKKKAAPKKESAVAKKVKAVAKETKKKVEKKTEKAAEKTEKEAKPKTTKKKDTTVPAA